MPLSKEEAAEEENQKPKYEVLILPSAQKQLDKLPDAVATRIEDKMMELGLNPRPAGCKKLKGRSAYRIRIGDYRVVYEINNGLLIVTVITMGHRKDVYDQ